MIRLNDYTLSDKIHESNFVEIHRGFRTSDGRSIVAKMLRGEYPSELAFARLRHEHRILVRCAGPGVVQCLGLERVGNGLALLLTDEGETSLAQMLGARERNLRKLLRIATAAARVVRDIQLKGILHKAIEPHHFMLDSADAERVVVVDFSAATILTREPQSFTTARDLGCSLQYIAPEQTGRMNRVVDRRSDLYSLGATLYALFTGHPPFQVRDPLELIHSHLTRTPVAPHELSSDIPLALSSVIMKLLSKVAEDRYQGAEGLVHDLEQLLEQLSLNGSIGEIAVGAHDVSGELRPLQKLYGRETEVGELRQALSRVQAGRSELLLVSGPSGIGKSVLVRELFTSLEPGDYFAAGKFEHIHRSVPYAALARACAEIVHALLGEPPQVLADMRELLVQALGKNGRLMIDLVPELELIIGPQPDVPALGPSETQSRFELVFERFLAAFASRQHSLVLYLDDLQWADAASLRLLELALSGSSCNRLLVIGTYRDTEVDAGHPLTLVRESANKSGVTVRDLAVGPLTSHHVTELLSDAFGTQDGTIAALAEVLIRKTNGNPFFLGQFLASLVQDQVLWFDSTIGQWHWELSKVESALATDNVVDFMLGKLKKLPLATQELLQLAACVGHEFDVNTLVQISQRTRSHLTETLWPALATGLIVPMDGNYCLVDGDGDGAQSAAVNARYRFLHDRVTQAAYALLDDTEKQATHLAIGRLLLATRTHETDSLFQIVDHLNRGSGLLDKLDEKQELARLNLDAGRRARAGAAAEAAIRYLTRIPELLDRSGWVSNYTVMLPATLLRAECEQLIGRGDEALELLAQAEGNVQSLVDRTTVRNLCAIILTNLGRLRDAVDCCVETMRALGDVVPSADDVAGLGAAIGAEFGALQAERGSRPTESLADLPKMTDPIQLALVDTYAKTIPAAFQSVQELMVVVVLKATRLSLVHGTAPATPFMYTQYGLVHSIITGDRRVGYQFGELGIRMAQHEGNPALEVQPRFIFGGFLAHWLRPIAESLEQLRTGMRLGLDTGDTAYTCYCAGFIPNFQLYSGENLLEIQQSLPSYFSLVNRTNDIINRGFLLAARQAIAALRGETAALASLDSSDFSELEFEASTVLPPVLAFYGAAKALVRFIAGRPDEALKATETFTPLPNILYNAEYKLLHALGLADRIRTSGNRDDLELLRQDAAILAQWAEDCPANHAHRFKLVSAEIAALESRDLEAMELFDAAAELAREHGFLQHQAIACELCARFHLRHDRRRIATAYLQEALYAYQRWGASAKVAAMQAEYRQYLGTVPAFGGSGGAAVPLSAPSTHPDAVDGQLDIVTAIRATETIATELDFDRVIEQLMLLLSESAGAQRGFLLLDAETDLNIVATIAVAPNRVEVGQSKPLASSRELSATIVRLVARTLTSLVLDDASADVRFHGDSYVARNRPKSILCVPILHRGHLTGVLYLENNSTTHGFSPARTEFTRFLAAQAGAALENARLYGNLNGLTAQLRASNETLESQVAERTRDLEHALADLWSEMDLARKIQTVLLPKTRRAGEFVLAARMLPADVVGGDYYDVITTKDCHWIVIGDVSGHGVTAGLIMMMIQTAIRTLVGSMSAGSELSPAEVLARTNAAVRSNLEKVSDGQYMTVTLFRVNGSKLTFAGLHQDLLIYRRATQTVDRVETHGVWVGVLDQVTGLLQDDVVELDKDDVLLLYSDGMTELDIEGKLLGTEGLARRLHALASKHVVPDAIVQGLLEDVAGRQLKDDITLVVLRHDPDDGSKAAVDGDEWSRAELSVRAKVELVWSSAVEVRRKLGEKLSTLPQSIRDATVMVASELLENAIKYGERVPSAQRIDFSFELIQGTLRVAVSNGSTSSKNIARLEQRVAELAQAEDKFALYLQRLEARLEQPSEQGGLGLYRIGAEGGFQLRCRVEKDVVEVVATRSIR